jgi:hypothetical protein
MQKMLGTFTPGSLLEFTQAGGSEGYKPAKIFFAGAGGKEIRGGGRAPSGASGAVRNL